MPSIDSTIKDVARELADKAALWQAWADMLTPLDTPQSALVALIGLAERDRRFVEIGRELALHLPKKSHSVRST